MMSSAGPEESAPAAEAGAASRSMNDQMAIHEKMIEEKESMLQRLLSENRNKLMEVEAELSVLRRDIKLTSAPKKQAMELMRRKIEEASERVRLARDAKLAAAAALSRAEAELVAEESNKAQLVADLNSLILQSTVQQYKALETLQTRMDGLTARVAAPDAPPPEGVAELAATASSPRAVMSRGAGAGDASAAAGRPESTAVDAARAEMEAAAAVDAAAAAAASEARNRHVARPRPGGKPALLGSKAGGGGSALAAATTGSQGGFAGFAV